MSGYEKKQNTLQKFNIFAAIVLLIALFLFANSGMLFSQTFKEVNFPEPSVKIAFSKLEAAGLNYRIYQSSASTIKFELPEVSFVKIGLYNSNRNLIRTYIYNNLQAGNYDINLNTANLEKGNYTCVLQTADVQESSQVIIE